MDALLCKYSLTCRVTELATTHSNLPTTKGQTVAVGWIEQVDKWTRAGKYIKHSTQVLSLFVIFLSLTFGWSALQY